MGAATVDQAYDSEMAACATYGFSDHPPRKTFSTSTLFYDPRGWLPLGGGDAADTRL